MMTTTKTETKSTYRLLSRVYQWCTCLNLRYPFKISIYSFCPYIILKNILKKIFTGNIVE